MKKARIVFEKTCDFSGAAPGWKLGQQGFNFFSDGTLITSYSSTLEQPSSPEVPVEASSSVDGNGIEGKNTTTSSSSGASRSVLVVISRPTGQDIVREYDQSHGLPPHFSSVIPGENRKIFMMVG
jgi:hypothetical protein